MTLPRFDRLRAGGKLPAHELNQLTDAARASQLTSADGGLEVSAGLAGLTVNDHRPVPIWAKITGGSNPYAWQLLDDTQQPLAVLTGVCAVAGSASPGAWPAYEANGNASVSVGTIVQLMPASSLDRFFFALPSSCNPLPAYTRILGGNYPLYGPGPISLTDGSGDFAVLLQPNPNFATTGVPASYLISCQANIYIQYSIPQWAAGPNSGVPVTVSLYSSVSGYLVSTTGSLVAGNTNQFLALNIAPFRHDVGAVADEISMVVFPNGPWGGSPIGTIGSFVASLDNTFITA
jgi:hypothetical protein